MSAQREYQMSFVLGAALGASFSSAFSQANAQLQRTQEQARALLQAQSDISAYQKQQSAVEATSRKLEDLQKQYDNIRKEYEETGESSSALANKMIDKQRAIDQTNQKLQQQTQKLDEMEAELKEAGIDTGNLAGEQQKLSAELDKAAKEAEEYGQKGASAFEAAGAALAAAGVAEGLKEITEAYKECVALSTEFHATMSTVEALSGSTAEEMAALTAQAKELGATTKYTATESASAMTYMGMAGWDAQQMLNGMDGVLALAAASGEDLAMVSDVVTDNLTAFGMKAEETGRFADVLAAAATNSNTSVSVMAETFKKAGPVAGALGYSIEDVSVAVGLMANAGVKGSRAGTALSNTFTGLLSGVTLTGQAIGEVEVSAVQADGTMMSFADTVNTLRGYFDQLTEAEKVQNAQAIAGKLGYSGLLAVLNATDEDYQSLTNSINDCSGAAQKMADIKMNNLQGQMTLMNSAADALKTTIGEAYDNELQKIVKIGTKIISGINDFLTKHPAVLKAIIAVTAEVAAFVAAYTAYQAVQKAVLAAQLLLNSAMLANPWVIALAGVAALTVGIIALVEAQDKEAKEIRELSESSRDDYEALQEKNAEYERAAALYGENSEEAQYLKWQVEELSAAYEANKQSLEEYMAAHDEMIDGINEHLESYRQQENAISTNGTQTLALVHRLQELSSQTRKTVTDEEEMKAIIGGLNKEFPELGLKISDVTKGLVNIGDIEAMAKKQAEAEQLQERYEALTQNIKDIDDAERSKAENDAGLKDAKIWADEAAEAYERLYGNGNLLALFFSEEGRELRQAEKEKEQYSDALAADEEKLEELGKQHEELTGKLGAYATATQGATEDERAFNEAITATGEQIAVLTQAYAAAYTAAQESIAGQYALWDDAADVSAVSASKMTDSLADQQKYWEDYNANIQTLLSKAGEIDGLSEMIATFGDGSEESVNAIAGLAEAAANGTGDLEAMVSQWQATKTAQDEAAASLADLTTGYTTQMDELAQQMAQDVEDMDLSDEALLAGQQTIQGFIDGAVNMTDDVAAAYASVAQAAVDAINKTLSINSPSRVMQEKAFYTWLGFIEQTQAMREDVAGEFSATAAAAVEEVNRGLEIHSPSGVMREKAYFTWEGYVEETERMRRYVENAARETITAAVNVEWPKLPETAALRQIEAYTHSSSAEPLYSEAQPYWHDASGETNLTVNIRIDGNADSDTVEQLRNYAEEELREKVLAIMDEANVESTRRVYR